LLEVHGVGVRDSGDGGGDEDAAGAEFGGACGLGEEEGVLGGVRVGPVEVVGAVGDAVARGELARGLEGLDELVLLGGLLLAGGVLVDAADFAGAGLALIPVELRPELGGVCVEGLAPIFNDLLPGSATCGG
jgi:hypothetical protein